MLLLIGCAPDTFCACRGLISVSSKCEDHLPMGPPVRHSGRVFGPESSYFFESEMLKRPAAFSPRIFRTESSLI